MSKRYARGIEFLRQPDRNPRCYEMTDQEIRDVVIALGEKEGRMWSLTGIRKRADLGAQKSQA